MQGSVTGRVSPNDLGVQMEVVVLDEDGDEANAAVASGLMNRGELSVLKTRWDERKTLKRRLQFITGL